MYALENCSHPSKNVANTSVSAAPGTGITRDTFPTRNSFPVVWPVFLQRPRGKVFRRNCRVGKWLKGQEEMWFYQSGENSTHLCCWIYPWVYTRCSFLHILYFVGTGKFQVFCMIKDVTTVASISSDLGIQTPKPRQPRHSSQDKPPSIWMILKDLRYTQAWRLTAGTCPHGGLEDHSFLNGWFVGYMIQ